MKQQRSKLSQWSRRDFLKATSITAGALAFGAPAFVRGRNLNSKLNIASIGVMGKGESDVAACADENIVALCDVDEGRCAKQIQKYASAKFYRDFRKMFDEMASGIDAVTISTPDHFHAVVASAAMQQGKHVHCQKPLTQTIYEARYLRDLAHKKKIITQMGNQGSASDGLRRAVECIQAGLIGQVHEVHVWTNRPVWPQGMNRPEGSDPVPNTLSWDIWLGPAPKRPYKGGVYTPFNWRGWQDFGTGALGDMACHTVNMPFRGLNLGYPTEIEAEPWGTMNNETYPLGSKIRFQFPARQTSIPAAHPTFFHHRTTLQQDALTFWWYDGGNPEPKAPNGHDFSNKPPRELTTDIETLRGEVPNSGSLLVGDKGVIFSPDDYGEDFFIKLEYDQKYLNYKKHPAVAPIAQWIPRNRFGKDGKSNHPLEWIAAIKENKPELCYSRFDISAQLTEIMLLGCVALRARQKIEWDGPNMRATNCPEAAAFVKREDYHGWVLS
jgi:hypothetical protein